MIGGLRLLGRDQELTHLHRRLIEAMGGNGGLILIEGEAGIGKSALAVQVMLESGIEGTAVGRSPGLGETPPFGPWLEIMNSLSTKVAAMEQPLGPTGTDSYQTAHELADATLAWFSHLDCPLLLLLEDIHWADPASLELLRHLTPLLGRSRLLILATCRNDEVSRQHPLWSLLPNLQRSGAERLQLYRLSEASVEPLLTTTAAELGPGAAGALRALYHRTDGHPLFLMELIAAVRRHGLHAI